MHELFVICKRTVYSKFKFLSGPILRFCSPTSINCILRSPFCPIEVRDGTTKGISLPVDAVSDGRWRKIYWSLSRSNHTRMHNVCADAGALLDAVASESKKAMNINCSNVKCQLPPPATCSPVKRLFHTYQKCPNRAQQHNEGICGTKPNGHHLAFAPRRLGKAFPSTFFVKVTVLSRKVRGRKDNVDMHITRST